ncbi:hypothetical protein, partial [Xanthomonas nasturtii]|uniref:hypothetical protein n=1 Tax=Xanthomonas nasturtii TaxID=1843581 RepID=UPI002011EA0B
EETLYRYRITGTELKPEWREAIDLATQRCVCWMQDEPALLYFAACVLADNHMTHYRALRHGVPPHVQHS